MKRLTAWFPTLVYCDRLLSSGTPRFNRELLGDIDQIRKFDVAGQKWSASHYPGGYTSYGSLDKVHRMSSTFMDLESALSRHVKRFVRSLAWDLQGRELVLTDCWINVMPKGTSHGLHLHPLSVLSGTYYVSTPVGSSGLKFEDPRLSRMMACPPRKPNAPASLRPHITYPARAGNVILFESWLRHEVPASRIARNRVSISFNYAWS